jgi:hypothetical protein
VPAGDGIQVNPDDLIVHAGHLHGIADAVAVARQAGQTVRLGADAYGQLCGLMPVLLGQLQRVLVDGIGTAEHSVRDTAGRLRTVAARYQATDGQAAAELNRIRARM